MSSICRLATKTLLISSCFVALFVSGFISSVVVAKEVKPEGSTCIREAKVVHSLFASVIQAGAKAPLQII
jgi:alkaline phosphatase D